MIPGSIASGFNRTRGYKIERSLRFNPADSAYLNKTPGGAGNRRTWTVSFWFKRSVVAAGVGPLIWGANAGANDYCGIIMSSTDVISVQSYVSGVSDWLLTTSQVLRDPSAWYHIVVAVDTTQGTAANRVKLYINGVQVTAFSSSSYPTQNYDTAVNNTVRHLIGSYNLGSFIDGYLAEFNMIDGQALTPSSFGATNVATGQWDPIKYTGAYGTNGFYLNFSDNSGTTATTLGKDSSGNGNNWTPNNFSVSAGAGNDSLTDTPTNYGSGNAGGDVRGNICTWNPVCLLTGTLANGAPDPPEV